MELLLYYFRYIAYGVLFVSAVAFGTMALLKRTPKALLGYGIPSLLIWTTLITGYYNYIREERKMEMANVGTYYLSEYQELSNCQMILNEDHTYQVIYHNKILKKGTWKYLGDVDDAIVSLDDLNWLGYDDYAYDSCILKYPRN